MVITTATIVLTEKPGANLSDSYLDLVSDAFDEIDLALIIQRKLEAKLGFMPAVQVTVD